MSFMTLPVELRAQIIDLVLCRRRERPTRPDAAGARSNVRDHQGKGLRHWYKVMYEDDLLVYTVDSANLVRVNRQLRVEVMTVQTSRARLGGMSYELDVIVDGDRNLLPTWTYVPAVSRSVENLNVTFRLFGHGLLGRDPDHRVWNASCGAPPTMTCNLYKLLERFFVLGASAPRDEGFNGVVVGGYSHAIRCLNVNVERTVDTRKYCTMNMDCHPVASSRLTPWEEVLGDLAYTWHPERYYRFMHAELANLLDVTRRTAEFGSVLYQNIGRIKLSLDGVLLHEFDLGRMLLAQSNNRFPLMFGRAQVALEDWRAEVLKIRERNGLSLVAAPEEASVSAFSIS